MKIDKYYIKPLLLAAAAMLAVTGCSGQNSDTEASVDSAAEASTETQAVLEKVTYTSTDGSVSIILPDSNWTNTVDTDGKLVFAADGKGEISIDYAQSKDELSSFAFGSTEEKLLKRLEKLGMDTGNLEMIDYSFDKSTGVRFCSYTLKYSDTSSGIYYTTTSVSASSTRGYQVSGNVKADDAALLAAVQESVNSFLVLTNPLTAEETEDETGAGDIGETTEISDGTRYFYDEPGNTIYVTQNSDGAWVDEDGMEYTFYEDGVEDSNGTWYYYSTPAYRTDSSGSDSDSDSASEDSDVYYDFYDSDGNYIKCTQDENGNWVDENGEIYIFGEYGVTDSEGNFHPY